MTRFLEIKYLGLKRFCMLYSLSLRWRVRRLIPNLRAASVRLPPDSSSACSISWRSASFTLRVGRLASELRWRCGLVAGREPIGLIEDEDLEVSVCRVSESEDPYPDEIERNVLVCGVRILGGRSWAWTVDPVQKITAYDLILLFTYYAEQKCQPYS